VRDSDLAAVLAGHDPAIVMFDVSPPDEGVRGMKAYRETWPPFFEWLASGAVFRIESLDVAAGTDVAFAYALLRFRVRFDRPFPYELDGGSRTTATKLRVKVHPGAITICVPAKVAV